MLKYIIFSLFLLYFTYTDIKDRTIPNKILAILFGIGLLFLFSSHTYRSTLIGVLLPSSLFFILNLLGNHFIGGGDIKLICCLGLFCGFQGTCIIVFLSLMLCLFYALIMFLSKNSCHSLPLCPFLSISFYIFMIYTALN